MGSQIFSDPLGLKIRKIAKTGHYGPLFWRFFFLNPLIILVKKTHGEQGPVDPQLFLKVVKDWTNILDEGRSIDIINMDFQKALDKVTHKILLYILERYGI